MCCGYRENCTDDKGIGEIKHIFSLQLYGKVPDKEKREGSVNKAKYSDN
jgi:hypothetical protein